MTKESPTAEAAAGGACANCGTASSEAFCGACGQPAGAPKRDFSSFVHELLGSFFAFDGRVRRSLVPLFTRPGRLTRAWIDGRRVSFVPPLRLFLFFTILLFLVVNCKAGTSNLLVQADAQAGEGGAAQRDAEEVARSGLVVTGADDGFHINLPLPGFWPFTRLRGMLEAQEERLEHMQPNVRQYVLARRALELAPIGLLMLLPIMAFFLQLWWLRTGAYWLDHLVFLLHAYAFCSGLVVLVVLVPLPNWVVLLALLGGVPAYFHRAMRVVHQRSFWRTLVGTLIGGFLTAFGVALVCLLLFPYLLLTV